MTGFARCPDCGHEIPRSTAQVALCPFCLLQLGLDSAGAARSPWFDPADWSCRVLNVLGVEGGRTRYLAEQATPRRLVVLAPLEVTLDREGERSRLQGLLQVLVDFDHTLAARVFGAVASNAGIVYLVSEHVPGTPVVLHCERTGLDARGRRTILRSVADVVRAAHEQAIVHSSLSSSRVVIATRGGEPTPIVTGFGESLKTGAVRDAAADVGALADLGRQLGLELPAHRLSSAAAMAAWLAAFEI